MINVLHNNIIYYCSFFIVNVQRVIKKRGKGPPDSAKIEY